MKTILHNCPKCNKEFNAWSKWGLKKFCSRECANSRGPRSDEFKKLVSKKLSGRKGKPNPNKGIHRSTSINKACPCCGKDFLTSLSKKRKYCSDSCRKQRSGGYREGSGRAKTGYYKGIYCGSTYELVWVIYQLDHKLPFERFLGHVEYEGKKYFPDFLQNGKIVEIKGFEKQESVDLKTKVANKNGYEVIVLRKKDLQKEFNHVKQNYQYKLLQELYDGFKPEFNYKCDYCGKDFHKKSKSKTEVNFCSRHCAGKGHKGRTKGQNQYSKLREAAGVATSPSN